MPHLQSRTQLVARLLSQGRQRRRQQPILSVGQGFAGLGSDLITALAQRRATKETKELSAQDRQALQFALRGRQEFFDPDDPTKLLTPGTTPGSPETLAIAAGLAGTPEQAQQITGLGLQQVFAQQAAERQTKREIAKIKAKPEKLSALQEKIEAFKSIDIPNDIAVGLAAGQFGISEAGTVLDKVTGLPVNFKRQEVDQPTVTPTEVTQPDISEALGPTGAFQTGINRIVDLFGGDLPFQETSKGTAQLANLNNEAIQLLRAGLGGRPNVQLQKRIEKLLVEPNEIFGGEQEAKNKFQALVDTIDTEAARLEGDIQGQRLRPATINEAQSRLSELRALSSKFRNILESQTPRDKGDIQRFFR